MASNHYILDTHCLIWFQENNPKIPKKVMNIIQDLNNTIYFSQISLLEISIKQSLGKLTHFDTSIEEIYNQALLDGGIRWNTALESNNGVIAQQEFTYVKTEPGQGVYTWIDYNNNGIQELEEFEVAQFQDQAEYIRILLPNQVFLKIRQNKFSQILTLNPQNWSNKEGFKKLVSHFYNQTSYVLDRKVKRRNDGFNINPFPVPA